MKKFLTSGKVKDIYQIDDATLLFKFSDRISAYDVKFEQEIPRKGNVLCTFAEFWFNRLPTNNHFIKRISDTEILVKKMKMLPIECVVRGYFYGSLVNRFNKGQTTLLKDISKPVLASKLPQPIFDPTTKSDTHDVSITKHDALQMNLVRDAAEYDHLARTSIEIYEMMAKIVGKAGFILADLKLEFGRLGDHDDQIIALGDSIGPDECRLWPKVDYVVGKTQESYDKQILRDWLSASGYKKQFDDKRNAGEKIIAPHIPQSIIQKMTQRYVTVCNLITDSSL